MKSWTSYALPKPLITSFRADSWRNWRMKQSITDWRISCFHLCLPSLWLWLILGVEVSPSPRTTISCGICKTTTFVPLLWLSKSVTVAVWDFLVVKATSTVFNNSLLGARSLLLSRERPQHVDVVANKSCNVVVIAKGKDVLCMGSRRSASYIHRSMSTWVVMLWVVFAFDQAIAFLSLLSDIVIVYMIFISKWWYKHFFKKMYVYVLSVRINKWNYETYTSLTVWSINNKIILVAKQVIVPHNSNQCITTYILLLTGLKRTRRREGQGWWGYSNLLGSTSEYSKCW